VPPAIPRRGHGHTVGEPGHLEMRQMWSVEFLLGPEEASTGAPPHDDGRLSTRSLAIRAGEPAGNAWFDSTSMPR